jgi:uncharacterized membrane protein (UPF0127 family)
MRLVNARTGTTVAGTVEVALTRSVRRRGLLGRDALDLSTALILAPCAAVHTVFMRFPIDVVFVDRRGGIRRIVRNLQPWRMAASLRAYAAVEMAGGVHRDLLPGDRLYLAGTGASDLTALPGMTERPS